MNDWCILRTKGSSTLRLASSLAEAGFEVWTPVEHKPGKTPQADKIPVPLIPTFIFASYDRLFELVEMARPNALAYRVWDKNTRRMELKGHGEFWVLREHGKFSSVPDHELTGLRMAERRRKPRGSVKSFKAGDRVKLVEGGFAGLSGVVTSTRGKSATVSFPGCGFMQDATFGMWLLLDDTSSVNISKGQSEQALIAKAA